MYLICVSDTIDTVCLVVWMFRKMVAGRNDDAIAEALRMLAGSIGQIPQVNAGNRNGDDDEFRALGKF